MVANKSFSLLELLRNAGIDQAEFLRQGLEVLIQQLMEAEVRQQIGAEPYERTEGQTNSLSGGRLEFPRFCGHGGAREGLGEG